MRRKLLGPTDVLAALVAVTVCHVFPSFVSLLGIFHQKFVLTVQIFTHLMLVNIPVPKLERIPIPIPFPDPGPLGKFCFVILVCSFF